MENTAFIPGRWVKFKFNHVICIGITFRQKFAAGEVIARNMVYFISADMENQIIGFGECVELRYLQFITKPTGGRTLIINKDALTFEAEMPLKIYPNMNSQSLKGIVQHYFNQLFTN